MAKKVIWLVNEYNFPDYERSRQTNLCRLLNADMTPTSLVEVP